MVDIGTEKSSDPNIVSMVVKGLPQPPIGNHKIDMVHRVFWKSNFSLDQSGRAWLPAMLPILMRANEPGLFEDAIDGVALSNSAEAQKVLSNWYPWLERIKIHANISEQELPTNRGVGVFFSGGVDSFYSVLSNFSKVSHLILIKNGFDIRDSKPGLEKQAHSSLLAAAKAYGKPLITVETNIRELSNGFSPWGPRYHGAALATVAQLLSTHLSKVFIPSSFQEKDLKPWGTHPSLDSLWSSSDVEIIHDSTAVSRPEKVKRLSADPIAMKYLRVCWKNYGGAYNCGYCEKCLRTKVALYAVDALEACQSFDSKIDLDEISSIKVTKVTEEFVKENLHFLATTKGKLDPVYLALLQTMPF